MKRSVRNWGTTEHSLLRILAADLFDLTDDADNALLASIDLQEAQSSKGSLWVEPQYENLEIPKQKELVWRGHLTQFGLSSLKPFQKRAMVAKEKNKNGIVLQPTGSGKGLGYQLPALFEEKKVTIVICPTLSLIYSQVEELTAK